MLEVININKTEPDKELQFSPIQHSSSYSQSMFSYCYMSTTVFIPSLTCEQWEMLWNRSEVVGREDKSIRR